MRSTRTLAILIMLAAAAHAADFYVSPSGSDANPGTRDAPFATIAKAGRVVTAGGTVHVAPGSYAGGIVTTANGTATARIRYVSDTRWGARIDRGSGDNAWWNRGDYADIVGFEIDGTASPTWRMGLYLNGSHVTVSGNKVHAILRDPNAAATKRALSGGGGAGIDSDNYYGDIDISVIGNLVYDIAPTGTRQSLIHGIYQIASGTVANNIVRHTTGTGITLWHDAHDIVIANNTVFATKNDGIVVGAGDGGIGGGALSARAGDYVTVANNIVVNCGEGISEFGRVGTHNRYLDNLSSGNPEGDVVLKYGSAVGTIVADPQFANVSLNDFHLKPTSPAIDRAVATFAPAADFDGIRRPQGSAPDIGAYERIPTSLPSGWSAGDIGAVGKPGSTSQANGVWTVAGAGADIWGTVDAFRFASRRMSGDGEIVARVTSQTNTHAWAKAGVMIRETLSADSRYAMCSLTPSNGTQFLRRLSPGGVSSYTAGAQVGAPYWLKLVRIGSTFTAYQSADGTTWTRIAAATIPMGTDVFVGLAVSSHDVNAVSTAVFDAVSVTAGPVGSG